MDCMGNVQVAIACCRRSETSEADDLYPDPDAAPLTRALNSLGITVAPLSWDDPLVDWASFDRVIVSSTWDSVDRPTEYLAWARRTSGLTTLINPAPILEWALDKTYLRELSSNGIPTIPTLWIGPSDSWEQPDFEFVVKPSISAGGRETARYVESHTEEALAHVRRLQSTAQTVMVQPFITSVADEGEIDLTYFDGELSHAVRKNSLLQPGEGVVERLWERLGWSGQMEPTAEQAETAEAVMAYLTQKFGRPPIYGRVDLVKGLNNESLVIEIELIDPYLSLDVAPGAASRFARAAMT
jgi:hypothetical protein